MSVPPSFPAELRALGEMLPPQLRAAVETAVFARLQVSRLMGRTHEGARDVNGVLGYDDVVTTQQYRDWYARGGIAGRCVDLIPKAVWQGDGELIEDQDPEVTTQFEQAWYDLNDKHQIWSTLQRAHIQAENCSFSVLLIGAGGDWTQELPRARVTKDLLYIEPFGGGVASDQTGARKATVATGADVMIAEWDENVRSERFGQPIAYRLKRTNFVSAEFEKPVHWTRVIHIPAEGFVDDKVFGPPALEGVWNYLQDLVKCVGGGSETSWLAGYPGMHMDIDKDMAWPGLTPELQAANAQAQIDAMKAKAEEYKHQLTRWLMTRGVEVKMLQGKAVDFSANADTLITLIAGTRGIPKRILVGSERGELASGQDRQNFADIVNYCRTSYAHPIILRPFIERLIQYNYLPKPKEWVPKWPESGGMSFTEKIGAAKTMAELNDHGQKVVKENEIREFMGWEPFTDEEIEENKEEMMPPALATPPDAEDDSAAEEDSAEQVAKLEAALAKYGSITIGVGSGR